MSPPKAEQRPVTQQDLQALEHLLVYYQGGLVGLLTTLIKIQLGTVLLIVLIGICLFWR